MQKRLTDIETNSKRMLAMLESMQSENAKIMERLDSTAPTNNRGTLKQLPVPPHMTM